MNGGRFIRAGGWCALLALVAACARTQETGFAPDPDAGVGFDDGSPIIGDQPSTGADFPDPIVEATAPANAPALFGAPNAGAPTGGPCLVEPESDVLYPQNWLRPRFRWLAGNANLFELRLHVANQTKDLLVYTSNTSWTMPRVMWDGLRNHSAGAAMTLSVRSGFLEAGSLRGVALGSQTSMGIAPVQATGAIVYWTTNDAVTGRSMLKGFSPGDESVVTVITPAQYGQEQQKTSQCIGCHTSTPDGTFAAFTTTPDSQQWRGGLALIDQKGGAVGAAPSFLTAAGADALARFDSGGVAFSVAHWKQGDRRAIVSYDKDKNATNVALSWVDLEAATAATATGTIARTGDSRLAGAPTWSHDGASIAYVSTNRICTGRLGNCTPSYNLPPDPGSQADVYVVPYADGAGGAATGLPGASDPTFQEYYPAFSPDDRWLAFNRIANDLNLYNQPAAELFVIPRAGGTATRLAANDPPACTGMRSPGLDNVWPKWSPAIAGANGDTYYWMTFSSMRLDGRTQQLYMTSVVQRKDGSIQSHGALYLWNQPATENNHTPAWDKFTVTSPPR